MKEIDEIRRDLAMHDAGYPWGTKHDNVAKLLAEHDRLLAVVVGIAEFCSGDDRTLGAISRLTHIRNTADRAVRGAGETAT